MTFLLLSLWGCLDNVKPVDADGDGYEPLSVAGTDCDDRAADVHPGAPERCDGQDQDCDGEIDEEPIDGVALYLDADRDGLGVGEALGAACAVPEGQSAVEGDCDDNDPAIGGPSTWYSDLDGDGYGASPTDEGCDAPGGAVALPGDCDDNNNTRSPAATERCDGVDQDCDDEIDEDADDASTWYTDADGDGHGDPDTEYIACESDGGVGLGDDCDDQDAGAAPGLDELCDGWDNDCDGDIDEDDAADAALWYADVDGDGYGDAADALLACATEGRVADATDCDDTDAGVHPAGTETCDSVDQDCDGIIDEDAVDALLWYADTDADNYGAGAAGTRSCAALAGYLPDAGDCDDTNAEIRPDADERCDGADNNCDGLTDGVDAIDPTIWYLDGDADGAGDVDNAEVGCDAPAGRVADARDCDDTNVSIGPEVPEVCNGLDDDCDGATDEDDATDAVTAYVDGDLDGAGDPATVTVSCTAPDNTVLVGGDCDDTDPLIAPDQSERCNGADDDCDGTADGSDAIDASTWYADTDGDSFGALDASILACEQPADASGDPTDCDDSRPEVSPAADELCDGEDGDCDGVVDDDALDATTWYVDRDGDLAGDPLAAIMACTAPDAVVSNGYDCDDTDSAVRPGAVEECDGVDNNCFGGVDDYPIGGYTWYYDLDDDGYGDPDGSTRVQCDQPVGFVRDNTDCDDRDDTIYPTAPELCDAVDADCDGDVAEPNSLDAPTWYADADGDSYGNPAAPTIQCDMPAAHVADATDCDDADATINPAIVETCDGRDQDCCVAVHHPIPVAPWLTQRASVPAPQAGTARANLPSA